LATKEDILEQVVEEYLLHKGYFVRHNIKFRPRPDHPDYIKNKDSNHSDIDVLGYHPHRTGPSKVLAVSCKSWQKGFNPQTWLSNIESNKKISGRQAWQAFRELTVEKWSEAFADTIENETGHSEFTYILAVSVCKGDRSLWENHRPFLSAINGNPIRVIEFSEMISFINQNVGTTLAGTELGRLIQMFNAAGISVDAD